MKLRALFRQRWSWIAATTLFVCLLDPINALGIGPGSITVDDSFGQSQVNFQLLATQILTIESEMFGGTAPLVDSPIVCHWRGDFPETLVQPGRITIMVGVTDQRWSQFAFQLGHELGHVYLGPMRDNGYIEALATAVSFEVLDRLAKRWVSDPAIAGQSSWASNFTSYRMDYETSELRFFPDLKSEIANDDWNSVRLYLRSRENDMQQLRRDLVASDEGRALQYLAVESLRSQPIDWPKFLGFAHSSSSKPVTQLAGDVEYFSVTQQGVKIAQPEFCRMGEGCPSKLPVGGHASLDTPMFPEAGGTTFWPWY